MSGLTDAQVASFHKNGYLVVPDYLSSAEVSSLLSETESLLNNFSLEDHPSRNSQPATRATATPTWETTTS